MATATPRPEAAPLSTLAGRSSRWATLAAWSTVITWLLVMTLLVIVVGLPAALLGDRKRRVAHRMLAFGYAGMRLSLAPYRLEVTGLENLPDGPCILAANHQSLADVVYLYSLPRHFKWVVKKEFFRVPLFGIAMRIADYPVIERGSPDSALALLDTVGQELRRGVSILSFPEGTRSATGELQSFQTGTARMAILNQVPVVPVGVVGTGLLLPKGTPNFATSARVAIHVGRPLATTGMERSRIRKLTHELRQAVILAIDEAAEVRRALH